MPTEPQPTTLSEVVRRAAEICERDALSGDMERFVIDPGLRMAAAVTTYLAFRRDEVSDDDVEIMRLAARAEWHGHLPDDVARWLDERGISL
jgi:hypothetical protein